MRLKKMRLKLIDVEDGRRIVAQKTFKTIEGDMIKRGQVGGLFEGRGKNFFNAEGDFFFLEDLIKEPGSWWVYEDCMLECSAVFDNAVIKNGTKIFKYSVISGNSIIDNSKIHYAIIKNAKISNSNIPEGSFLKSGSIDGDPFEDMENFIYCSVGIKPDRNGYYTIYKWVRPTTDPEIFLSHFDQSFEYRLGQVSEAPSINEDKTKSVATGLHAFTGPGYEFDEGALLKCQVHINDVVTCLDKKLRVRKLMALGVEKYYE